MEYILLIYGDEGRSPGSPEEQEASMQAWIGYSDWLREKGWMVAGDPLRDTEHATTVRVRDGKTMTTDGPFAEKTEQLGGYYLLECENLDQALEAAAKCPGALYGSIEVRPVEVYDASDGG